MIERGFWNGYWAMLSALAATQLVQQVDVIVVGRLGGGAAAYVMLTRLAVVDFALMTAMSAVASTTVARAQRNGDPAPAIAHAITLAALAGVCCGGLGLLLYPRLAGWLGGEDEVTTLICSAVFWYSLSAPFRFLINTSTFVLHALGHGATVLRWKLIEVAAKTAGNILLVNVLELGFVGCFESGLVVAILSSTWCYHRLSHYDIPWFSVPKCSWTTQFLRSSLWEVQRSMAVHLAVMTGLALFAAQWLGHYEAARLSAYAAGQTLMLLVFSPLLALTRFLAFRLASMEISAVTPFVLTLWRHGAPIPFLSALVLFMSSDTLGDLYGQTGPWWSSLVTALATSLPFRHAANLMRAALLAQGAFATVSKLDSLALWLCALPLVVLGLSVDSPGVAYLSLIVPEACCLLGLWRNLRFSSQATDALKSS